jgi:5'-nucleotidase
MRILLTNDDGVNAPGLKTLEAIARILSDDIWIVAPAEENSGAGHSLTLSKPVRIRKHGEKHYSVAGTPTDSVMLALGVLMKDAKPDLILSGVNRGANLGDDVTYSGTVSAAMEGVLAGVRSIAMSQVYSKEGMGDAVRAARSGQYQLSGFASRGGQGHQGRATGIPRLQPRLDCQRHRSARL